MAPHTSKKSSSSSTSASKGASSSSSKSKGSKSRSHAGPSTSGGGGAGESITSTPTTSTSNLPLPPSPPPAHRPSNSSSKSHSKSSKSSKSKPLPSPPSSRLKKTLKKIGRILLVPTSFLVATSLHLLTQLVYPTEPYKPAYIAVSGAIGFIWIKLYQWTSGGRDINLVINALVTVGSGLVGVGLRESVLRRGLWKGVGKGVGVVGIAKGKSGGWGLGEGNYFLGF